MLGRDLQYERQIQEFRCKIQIIDLLGADSYEEAAARHYKYMWCRHPFGFLWQGSGACDDRWLYIAAGKLDAPEEAEVVIYDYQGSLLQRLSCKKLGTSLSFAFSTPEKVFFRVSGLNYRASILPICYLEKSAIAEGGAEFILLESPQSP